MKVKDVFDALATMAFVQSQVGFSTVFLGRSQRYYSHMIAVDHQPSIATMLGLAARLKMLSERLSCEKAEAVAKIAERVTQHCERRTITDVRRQGRRRGTATLR